MSRIDQLLAAMTVEEKIGQLTMRAAGTNLTGPDQPYDLPAGIAAGRIGSAFHVSRREDTHRLQELALGRSRLGIPLLFGLDVVHGYRTIFPTPLGEMAAFDVGLWQATAREAAAEAARAGVHMTFAPMLDIARDPRWGRIVEGPGEDTLLGVRVAAAKVRGYQGDNPVRGGGLAATAKHFVAYGAPAAGRDYAPVDISERTLREVYLPPFRAAVDAGVIAIMPAFNDIAGIPMSANRRLLSDVVRGEWGFTGIFVSDYDAVPELIRHGVAGDLAEAASLALRAGIDIEMMGGAYEYGLPVALKRDPSLIEDIDACVRRVLALKERLGLFDTPFGPGATPETPGGPAAPRTLARDAARRSIVVLVNRGVLPLEPSSLRRLALVGPLASARRDMLGPWACIGSGDKAVSVEAGLKAALPDCRVDVAPGVAIEGADRSAIGDAVRLAREADAVVLCLGEAWAMSGEASSRAGPGLPGLQEDLAAAVIETGTPTVALLSSGRPLIAPRLMKTADAVVAAWFLGSEAGHAIADVLTGRCEPCGRLPVSWPRSVGQIPVWYAERPSGRPQDPADKYTSKYLDMLNEPQFVFGHGLAYTRFRLSGLTVEPSELRTGEALDVAVEVSNDGERRGEETVLVFLHDLVASVSQPVMALKGFAKVALEPGETRRVSLTLAPEDFAFVGTELVPVVEPGTFEVLVGPRADRAALLSAKVTLLPDSDTASRT